MPSLHAFNTAPGHYIDTSVDTRKCCEHCTTELIVNMIVVKTTVSCPLKNITFLRQLSKAYSLTFYFHCTNNNLPLTSHILYRPTNQQYTCKLSLILGNWYTRFFYYKNFGSAPSTKSFLISHENFAIIVLKVS